MQNYEILYILPGTLGEDEIAPVVNSIKELVEKSGGTGVKMQDLGKSRIAYPIKHIRYGYFQLCQFQIESDKMPELRNKLSLKQNLLRAVVNKIGPGGSMVLDKISAISDVTVRETNMSKTASDDMKPETSEVKEVKETKETKETQEVLASADAISHQMDSISATQQPKSRAKSKSKTAETKTETKAENIKMEDIDKKLDELLETGINV